ncbi:MAG: hypothetical protein ABI700_15405 [Chloroflexota bacterium]
MTFQEILDKCNQLSVDERLQVIELLSRSIRETLQAQSAAGRINETHDPNNSPDSDAATSADR